MGHIVDRNFTVGRQADIALVLQSVIGSYAVALEVPGSSYI